VRGGWESRGKGASTKLYGECRDGMLVVGFSAKEKARKLAKKTKLECPLGGRKGKKGGAHSQ